MNSVTKTYKHVANEVLMVPNRSLLGSKTDPKSTRAVCRIIKTAVVFVITFLALGGPRRRPEQHFRDFGCQRIEEDIITFASILKVYFPGHKQP